MGNITSRRNGGVEQVDIQGHNAYKYPPQSGNYFGSHFIMGGERFDTPQPEAYLFGDNPDLNFLGNKPIPFPYPAPQPHEPTKTLKSLVNIRKDSIKFVKVEDEENNAIAPAPPVVKPKTSPKQPSAKKNKSPKSPSKSDDKDTEKKREEKKKDKDEETEDVEPTPVVPVNTRYNVEFTFDSDVRCAITIYYFATEHITNGQVTYQPRDASMNSETFHFKRGANQVFNQSTHIIDPSKFNEDDWVFNTEKEVYPVAIQCVVEDEADHVGHSHITVCNVEKSSDGSFSLKALKQKQMVDGLCYLLQEIFGIENKSIERSKLQDEEVDDSGAECVICMCDIRDTLILPCRHLCLCNGCADNLRYQSNNCPICRSAFHALLQIRAMKKKVTRPTSQLPTEQVTEEENPVSQEGVPAGFEALCLIEALNGPMATSTPTTAVPAGLRTLPPDGLPPLRNAPALENGDILTSGQSPHAKRKAKRQTSAGSCSPHDQPVLEEVEGGQAAEARTTTDPDTPDTDLAKPAAKTKAPASAKMRCPATSLSDSEVTDSVEIISEVDAKPKQVSKSAENVSSKQESVSKRPHSSPDAHATDAAGDKEDDYKVHSPVLYDKMEEPKEESDPLVNNSSAVEGLSLPGTPISTTDGSSYSSTCSTRGLLEKSPKTPEEGRKEGRNKNFATE